MVKKKHDSLTENESRPVISSATLSMESKQRFHIAGLDVLVTTAKRIANPHLGAANSRTDCGLRHAGLVNFRKNSLVIHKRIIANAIVKVKRKRDFI